MNPLNGDMHGLNKGPVMGTQSDGSDHCRADMKEVVSPVHNGLKIVNNYVPHRPSSDMNNHASSDVKSMKENKEHREHKKHSSSGNSVHKSSKHESSKHREHSSHGHKESSKEHSSKHSDSSKHKDRKVESSKPKDPNAKSSEHSSSKHSDGAKKDASKPKDHKEGDRSKKDSDKHKSSDNKSKDSTSSSKDKHKDSSNKDKVKEKHKDSKDKVKDKHKDGSDKLKSKEKLKEHSDKKFHGDVSDKVKKESHERVHGSPNHMSSLRLSPMKIKSEHNSMTVKEEPVSEDDIPLADRKGPKVSDNKKAGDGHHKSVKREKDDSDDDEPLAVRAEKVKKLKTEPSSASAKKRKMSDDDEDYEESKLKKVKKEKQNKKTKSNTVTSTTSSPTKSPTKKAKKEEEVEVWKWWEEEKPSDGKKWKTLQHNGPVFAPAYEPLPKNVKMYYDGKPFDLSQDAEEVAGFYARMLEHDYVTKESFNKNFFKDWRKVMTPEEKELITDLSKCDFRKMHAYFLQKSEERKNMTKEEKLEIKKQNEELTEKYGFCIIDGHKQKIGNFKIEPPGLFRGRGEHPKMGMLKRRIRPEDVIINIGKEAQVPAPPDGHKWKEIRHDNTVTWLACWQENILGQTKYIMLNPSSKLKGEKDWQKYEKARELKKHAERIRSQYQLDWKAKEMKIRQRAVALYFIDKLALRAGNEKEEGETADTVGCCSLRVEHITLHDEKDGSPFVVEFDFLGKDSIRYVNSVPVEKRVFKNLKLFMENKRPGDDLFDRLNTAILNKHLNELMEGLTAKVFRTYNASKTLQEQLDLLTKSDMSLPEKMLAYNRANRAVAILCNHQRSVPKTFDKQMEGLQKKIQEKKDQIREFKKELKEAKSAAKHSDTQKDRVLYERKKKRLAQLEEQLKKLEVQATDKEENKQIALGTSKLNYLDPRISVAWCKKWDVPIEKIYNRTQRDKFRWAIEMAGPDYRF